MSFDPPHSKMPSFAASMGIPASLFKITPDSPTLSLDLEGRECCVECKKRTKTFSTEKYYSLGLGDCIRFTCWNKACKTSCWYFCVVCDKELKRNSVAYHFESSKVHLANVAASMQHSPGADKKRADFFVPSSPCSSTLAGNKRSTSDAFMEAFPRVRGWESPLRNGTVVKEEIDNESISHQDEADNGSVLEEPTTYKRAFVQDDARWLIALFVHKPKCSAGEVSASLEGHPKMQRFWVAEHATPDNYVGGGLRYLVGRMFQRTELLEERALPDYKSAEWHLYNFMQFMSLSEKQRKRQARLLMPLIEAHGSFKSTMSSIVSLKQLKSHYSATNKHSLWNILPIPENQNVHGVAYVDPVSCIRYAFAKGLPLDDFWYDPNKRLKRQIVNKVLHISECKKLEDFLRLVDAHNRDSDGPIVVIYVIWWRDAFQSAKVKQNRKSMTAMTLSISPTKHKVNAVNNTFLIGLGLKTNKEGWEEVEHRMRRDLDCISDLQKPLMIYHGTLKTMVPVIIKPIAVLADKPERCDWTYTLGFQSPYHRCFGKSFRVDSLKVRREVEDYFLNQMAGEDSPTSHWGWSEDCFAQPEDGAFLNGSKLASCWVCRRARINRLSTKRNDLEGGNEIDLVVDALASRHCLTGCCADWCIDETTTHILPFKRPSCYPTFCAPNSPVDPPEGREVPAEMLHFVPLSLSFLKQAVKFAFFNASRKTRRDSQWNQQQLMGYLRTCGIATKTQKAIFRAAKAARGKDNEIDYDNRETLGTFRYPATWLMAVDIVDYCECVMHLCCLGVQKSLLVVGDQYAPEAGIGANTYKKKILPLMRDLKAYNIPWCLIMPFNGSESDLKTGAYVSENWLAFTRLSKVFFSPLNANGEESERMGGHDFMRVIVAWVALVARLLSHGGMTEEIISEIDDYVKEFLSAIKELDVRVRYRDLRPTNPDAAGADAKEGKNEPWWLRSNFMSLLNLVATIKAIGPLCNVWDGGGKAEKFIQLIKPHVPRGARDNLKFYSKILEKVFKLDLLQFFEECYMQIYGTTTPNSELVALRQELEGAVTDDQDEDPMDELTGDACTSENQQSKDEWDCYSSVEDAQMSKARTVHVYKKASVFNRAVAHGKPLLGVVIVERSGNESIHKFFCVFRKPRKQFGWRRGTFDDTNGTSFNGLFYADLHFNAAVEDEEHCPKDLAGIVEKSKMAALAIPLWYIIGKGKPASNKYCVITNWWKERQPNGRYELPRLDLSMYR